MKDILTVPSVIPCPHLHIHTNSMIDNITSIWRKNIFIHLPFATSLLDSITSYTLQL